MLCRITLAAGLAFVLSGCRDKQLDLQRATLARELTTANAAAEAAGATCKALAAAPVALMPPLEERKRELEAKADKSALEVQEEFMLRGMLLKRQSEVSDQLEKCTGDLKAAANKATEIEAKIADIDKIQPPEG